MFFEKSKIEELLKCHNCKDMLDKPCVLPCGYTICTSCSSPFKPTEKKEKKIFDCPICHFKHEIPPQGLTVSKTIQMLLNMKPAEISRGHRVTKLRDTLKIIDDKINTISARSNKLDDFLNVYCDNLETEVKSAKEEQLISIENYYKQLIGEINKYRMDRVLKLKANRHSFENFAALLEELKSFYDEWTSYLNRSNIENELAEVASTSGRELIKIADSQLLDLDRVIFDDLLLKFQKPDNVKLDSTIGLLVFQNMTSSIVSCNKLKEIFDFCGFKFDQKWELAYRASRDGFSASDFHANVNSKKKTFIIIKSTNEYVFGGYTNQDWSGSGYKTDPHAFLFSYINKDNKPIIIKCSTPENAIYCSTASGPVFGSAHDLYICNDSNINNGSYSFLSYSYKHPDLMSSSDEAKLFLTDSFKFQTIDIEVYSRRET